MAIKKVEDPRSGEDLNIASGVVNGVFFNELKTIKTYQGKNGAWTPTHAVKIKVDNDYIGLGLTENSEVVRCKDLTGNYHDLARGMQVKAEVDVTTSGQYTNINSKSSKVIVIDATSTEQKQTYNKGSKGMAKRDNSGMQCGHALNGAMFLTRNKMLPDTKEFVELCYFIHEATEEVKKTYADKTGMKVDSYDLGASVGNAILSTCKLLTVAKKELLVEKTLNFLENIAAPLLAKIRDGGKKPEPKKEEAPEQESASEDEYDDMIPF